MNLSSIDLRLLRGLAAIARTGNFALAAQQVHVTQSALSQQMKELGDRLGLTLFQRQGRRSMLTDAGLELVQRVAPLIEQLDTALLESSSAGRGISGRLRVGATQTYLRTIALPAALALIEAHPNLRIDTRQLPAQRLLADLLDGEIDIGIFPSIKPHGNLVGTPLLSERFLAIGAAHSLAGMAREISLQALRAYPMAVLNRDFLMRQVIDRQLRHDKVELDIRLEVSGMDDVIAAVKRGKLVGIGTELACLGDAMLESRLLAGRFLSRSAGLYWRRGRVLTGSLLAFEAAAVRVVADLPPRQPFQLE